jgi:leucyl-tRNA synthetase
MSKIEFAAPVARAQGERVLYPQGYHCTDMPTKACSDKLPNEVALYGKNFERFKAEGPDYEYEKTSLLLRSPRFALGHSSL